MVQDLLSPNKAYRTKHVVQSDDHASLIREPYRRMKCYEAYTITCQQSVFRKLTRLGGFDFSDETHKKSYNHRGCNHRGKQWNGDTLLEPANQLHRIQQTEPTSVDLRQISGIYISLDSAICQSESMPTCEGAGIPRLEHGTV